MNTNVQDVETVGETEATLFEMLHSGTVAACVTLENSGANTLNYHFEEFNGSAWADMSALGTDLNNTLSAAQVKAVVVSPSYPQVRLRGNASGGAELTFAVQRHYTRSAGGKLPLLNI